MKRAWFLILIGLLAVPVLARVNAGWLEDVAGNDVIPTIRLAAGLALVDYWAANKGEDELKDLAVNGATHEIRLAAALALSKQWIGANKPYFDLIQVAHFGESEELQLAAVDPLLDHLIDRDNASLEEMYSSGLTFAVRYAAAKAYFQLNRRKFDRESLEAICKDENLSDGYRQAAAELLAGHYLFPEHKALSMEKLESLANTAENHYLRLAAAQALVNLLIQSDLSAADFWAKIVDMYLNPNYTDECRWAYARALAARWDAEL